MQVYEGITRIEPEECNHEEEYLDLLYDSRICCKKCGIVFVMKIKRFKKGIVIPYVEEFMDKNVEITDSKGGFHFETIW